MSSNNSPLNQFTEPPTPPLLINKQFIAQPGVANPPAPVGYQASNQSAVNQVHPPSSNPTNRLLIILLRFISLSSVSLLAFFGSALLPDIVNNNQGVDYASQKDPGNNQITNSLANIDNNEETSNSANEEKFIAEDELIEPEHAPVSLVEPEDAPAPAPISLVEPEPEPVETAISAPASAPVAPVAPVAPEPEPEPVALIEPESIINTIDEEFPLINQEIKHLAAQLGLTDTGKRVLYTHYPQIYDNPSNNGCTSNLQTTIIFGCWSLNSIKILRSSTMETTIAHEMLHGAYYDLYLSGSASVVDQYIDDFIEQNPVEVDAVLKNYEKHLEDKDPEIQRWIKYNELHSFIGTQFRDIPQEMEIYYAQFFKDRQVVVDFYENWQLSFNQKSEEFKNLGDRFDLQQQQFNQCYLSTRLIEPCQQYGADTVAYTNYQECLKSITTLFNECQAIKPEFIAYEVGG